MVKYHTSSPYPKTLSFLFTSHINSNQNTQKFSHSSFGRTETNILKSVLLNQLNMQHEYLIQQQTFNTYFNENEQLSSAFLFTDTDQGLGELVVGRQAMKPDPGLENVDFGSYGYRSEFETSYALPRTASCPPAMAEVAAIATKRQRKLNKNQNLEKFGDEEKSKEKKCAEEEGSKITDQNSNITTCSTSSNKNKKRPYANNVSKTDYIHVRARRGEATDSHSLAERARREKLSERMKYLQDLVPGCEKITGKTCMLDEIINYVQSLQKQVEFLSMKLAVINPPLEFDNDNYLDKEQENQNFAWYAELQDLYSMEYQQGRSPTFISQPFI